MPADKLIFPEYVKIGGHIVKIICPYEFKERSDLCGQYDHNLKEIRIADTDAGGNKTTEGQQISTFIHEILHAIDKTSGHRIFDDKEDALDGISEGLYQILVDNKDKFNRLLDAF